MFGDHSYPVVHDLQKPATDMKPVTRPALPHDEHAFAEQRHERGVARQDADLAVERRRDDGVGLTVKHS